MMNRSLLLLILCVIGYAQTAVCKLLLPVNFTYFQRALGYYCQAPNLYLETQYGGSFAIDTNGVTRETNDPNVRFTVKEVTTWDELVARTAELNPGVAKGVVHTPSLFWDGRQDIYWHANAEEDTISRDFKTTVDAYIEDCLAFGVNSTTLSPVSPETGTDLTTAPPVSPGDADEDGCSLNHTDPTSGDILDTESETLGVNETTLCFVFFFSRGCPHCAKVKEYINGDLRDANVTYQYEAYDVYKSDYSRRLIAGYNYFGWKGSQVVPTIFIGDDNDMTVLVGEDTILDRLLPSIQERQSQPARCYDFAALLKENPDLADSNLHWGVLTAAALVDSINPCAIAVLLILLGGLVQSVIPAAPTTEQVHPEQPSSSLQSSSQVSKGVQPDKSGDNMTETMVANEEEVMAKEIENKTPGKDEEMAESSVGATNEDVGDMNDPQESAQQDTDTENSARERQSRRRRAFLSGMAFISSVYISYYALGFGVFTAVSSTKVSGQILLALGVFIIVLGIWNIKDYFCYDIGYNVEIPRTWRPLLKRLLGAISSPWGAFAAGFLVCLFELPCTGGPYLFILGLLADKNTRTEAAFLLLYYNFIFVLPLIVINCMVFWGAAMLEKVGGWKEKYIRHLHLFAGLVLITLGALAVADSRIELF